jgi:hypothetical protein
MVVDPRELRREVRKESAAASEVFKGDHPCPGCGFNKRGLARWAACPDCGHVEIQAEHAPPDPAAVPKRAPRARPLLSINDLPRRAKRRVAIGATLVSLGVLGVAGSMGLAWMMLSVRAQGWTQVSLADVEQQVGLLAGFVALPGVALWVLGLLIVTPDVPPKPKSEAEGFVYRERLAGLMVDRPGWWPWAVRLSPCWWLWPLGAVVSSVQAGGASGAGAGWVMTGLVGALVAGLFNGFVCAHLRALSLAIYDDYAGSRFEQSMLFLPVLGVFTALFLAPPDLFRKEPGFLTQVTGGFQGVFLVIIFLGFVGWPVGRFVSATFSLAASARWSVANDVDEEERDNRFRWRSWLIRKDADEQRRREDEGGA